MPKTTKHGKSKARKVVHPNSRKAGKIGKKEIHRKKVNSVQNQTVLKHSLVKEKLLWVKDYIAEDDKVSYSTQDLCDIVESYLKRFDEELEQISIIKGIPSRKNNQHASRAAAINLTLSKERTDYQTCGIEMPDLCDGRNLKLLLAWDGELRYLQRIKLRRVKRMNQPQEEVENGDDNDDGNEQPEQQMTGGNEDVKTGENNHMEHGNDDQSKDSDDHDDNTVLDVIDEDLDDESEKT